MSLLVVHRPARTPSPPVATDPLPVDPPPALPVDSAASGWGTYLFPVLGGLGSVAFMLVNPSPVFILGGLLFALGSLGMGVGLYVQQRSSGRRRQAAQRRRYLAHLTAVRAEAEEAAAAQREQAAHRHPAPTGLWRLARDPTRVWERRPQDRDVLDVRVGLGPAALARPLGPAGGALPRQAEADPACEVAYAGLLAAFQTLDDLPVTVPLAGCPVLTVVGEPRRARAALRALLAQLVTFHEPDVVRLCVCAGPQARPEWGWVKWLPHAQHPESDDGAGPTRLVADDLAGLERLVGAELAGRRRTATRPAAVGHLVVVVDGPPDRAAGGLLAGAVPGVTVVHVVETQPEEPGEVTFRLRVDTTAAALETADGTARPITALDTLSVADAEALARQLSPVRLSADSPERALVDQVDLPRLLGVADPGRLDVRTAWAPRPVHDELRVPIGVDPAGEPVHLDLKESALDGMGPHGLVIGATGSGKSELLRTLVTALAVSHPPDRLAFVLVDFKGGATFAGMAPLPHVAGTVTNLEHDLTLVDRFHAALYGEMTRRQELLRAAGNLSSVREYNERRARGEPLAPLPSLLVVVDEFSELLANKPEFIDMFVAIGRLGRSLGMHLLLASQRLEEGRLRGLESHLSYRIGLRTFSAAESRAVLGVPDAYELPPIPGSAYLKVDVSVFTRLRVATVSAPYRRPGEVVAEVPRVRPFPARSPEAATAPSHPAFALDPADGRRASTMDVVVGQLAGAAPPAHQVWLPPLPPALPLDAVLDDTTPRRPLQVTVGVVDRPRQQRQDPLVLDLAGAGGHLAVVGGPRSGKSTLLRTLVTSLALTHSPDAVQLYCVDLGGGLLSGLGALPHVGTVTGRLDPERTRRAVGEVASVLEHRESYFLAAGVDTVDTFRARRAAGDLPDEEELGDVFLVIDNWPALRADFDDLEPVVTDIAARGLGYGVHLVLTANRWLDIRPNLRDNIGSRLELRLVEPSDSDVDRRAAAAVPAASPGRGLTQDALHFLAALPRVDGAATDEALAPALDEVVRRAERAWPGRRAREVRVLPRRLDPSALPPPGHDPAPGVPIGLAETDLSPVYVDLTGGDPHLLVFGDGESGKTALLRAFVAGLTARTTPRQAKVMVVDYRRTLLDVVPPDWLLDYAGSAPAAAESLQQLREALVPRLPGPDVTPAQLRERSWWHGPDCYLVVDDYDLVASPSGNPLGALLDLLPQARDVGLHVVLARRVGGMARSGLEPVLSRLRELGTQGVILSGDPVEGPLLGGQRARPLVPGRGLYVRRHTRPVLVQTVWVPPE